MFSGYELILLVLVPASLFDLWQYKVPNALYGAALIISLFRQIEAQGLYGICLWLTGIIIPFILCYSFVRRRMFGAADSKLYSVIGSFAGVSAIVKIMLVSLFFGAILALGKIILYRNGMACVRRLWQYMTDKKGIGNHKPYYEREKEGDSGIIPFTIAISLAVLWCLY